MSSPPCGAARHAVDHAARAERAGALARHRLQQGEVGGGGLGERAQHLREMHALLLVALELLGRQLGLVGRHVQVLGAVLPGGDRQLAHFAPAAAVVDLDRDGGAGFRAQRNAGERDPFAALASHHQALAVEVDERGRLGASQPHARHAAGRAGGFVRRRQRGKRQQESGQQEERAAAHRPILAD
jgi:hypothetical protein